MLKTPLGATPDEVRRILAPVRNDLSVALCTLGNPFSVGTIIRVAHSYLVREIILIGTTPHYEKASMGMEKYETIVRVEDESAFFEHARGRPLVCFERESARRSLYDERPFPDHAIFVFGSERFGTPQCILDRAHDIVAVPMHGVNNSLPVSICAGIALSEWGRRHYGGCSTQ